MFVVLSMLPGAFAQNANNDLEYRETEVKETDRKLDVSAFFEVQWHEFNNLDFRALDESSDQAILDSDDRNHLAFTGASLNLSYSAEDRIKFVLGASHRGLWGADQFGGTNQFGGWIYFNAVYVDLLTSKGERPVMFRVGRQFYKLGGLGDAPDFVMADVLDAIRVDIPLGGIGRITLFPIDVLSSASNGDGANFSRFNSQSTLETFGFRGDRMSRRHGLVLDLDKLGPASVKGYGFFTDVGALGTGSDISYDGLLGNFSDNDWVANMGLRAQATFGPVTPFAGFDASLGVDRKELVANDVTTNGFAVTAGATLDARDEDTRKGFSATAYFHYALGPTFGANGLMTSHGYVGMKGQQVGGLLANRYMGWHPSSYIGLFGVDDTPQDMDRKSGTQVIHANAGYDAGLIYGNVEWWMMSDTGFTNFEFERINEIIPPFGYSREEYAAQIRHGRGLGNEFNVTVGSHVHKQVDVFAQGGLMLVGKYYSIPVARAAGTALGSTDPQMPWGAMAGIRVKL